ncbi:uncharacterized protein LOC141878528 [Acropora palmata]|uniref:uncharacterized protein LOC141878528 n=1 Tax=Acropora palmata TaxID=6131 RepID=UPI003DA0F976
MHYALPTNPTRSEKPYPTPPRSANLLGTNAPFLTPNYAHEEMKCTSLRVAGAINNTLVSLHASSVIAHRTLNPVQITDLLHFFLRSTYFQYNGTIYKEREGVDMESPLVAVFANHQVKSLEEYELVSLDEFSGPSQCGGYIETEEFKEVSQELASPQNDDCQRKLNYEEIPRHENTSLGTTKPTDGDALWNASLTESFEDLESEPEQDSICSLDTTGGQEWMPTPQIKANLSSLNTFISRVRGRDVSPVRGQLHIPVSDVAHSTSRYYKRKSRQVCEVVLDCIVPGQSQALFQLLTRDIITDVSVPSIADQNILQKLLILYEESNSWFTKQEILSIFVEDFPKSQLKEMIPGLTKWRIDQARKHAALVGPGKPKELPEIRRTRLDPVRVDHFVDFIASPHYLQDVAFGTKFLKLSNGEKMEIPNVVRTVTASRLVNLYLSFCKEEEFVPLGKSTLFTVLKLCAASQKKSLAGLDNITTEGISSMQTLHNVVSQLGKAGRECKHIVHKNCTM